MPTAVAVMKIRVFQLQVELHMDYASLQAEIVPDKIKLYLGYLPLLFNGSGLI